MSHNILITGASGYLGGTLLAQWKDADLPPYAKLYALVRSEEQRDAVKKLGAEALVGDVQDQQTICQQIIDLQINIVYFLVDAYQSHYQQAMIKALGQVRRQTGRRVHFLQTSGAKQYSNHAGFPTSQPLLDTDPNLYDVLRSTKAPNELMATSIQANIDVIDTAEAHDVRSYIFSPCIVYGKGQGFGNQISIQDVAIVQAALKLRNVYRVDSGSPTWPLCHINDTTALYLQIMRKILQGDEIGYGRNGFYLAASGSLAWDEIYSAFAKALAKRKCIDDEDVHDADGGILQQMGDALGVSASVVPVLLEGKCTYTAKHGSLIGWKPRYPPEHLLEAADAEVELIIENLNSGKAKASVR
ncbi:hypothetical protein BJX61DRAFT_551502 [Aspergillus egyptiacus]|nr:hypothetical protein BJX61DRAFT_551502 [Aspergillus egyptiacus]